MAKLNVEKLNSRIDKVISSEEALKSIVPMEWSEDILTGNKQVLVTNISKDKENETCVSASFSYSKFTQSLSSIIKSGWSIIKHEESYFYVSKEWHNKTG